MQRMPSIQLRAYARGGLAAGVLAIVSVVSPAAGQTVGPLASLRPAILERNAPAEGLIKKAEDALARKDWKLAIDSLQRVLDEPGAGLLRSNTDEAAEIEVLESPKRRALALLASLPPEGLNAYRVLFDGKAETLLREALAVGDEAAVRAVAQRYFVTRSGDDAASVLAGQLLDRQQPAAALAWLRRIAEDHPDPDVPAGRLAAQRVAALAMVGDIAGARALLEDPASSSWSRPTVADLRALLDAGWREPAGRSGGEESWPIAGGGPQRRGIMPAVLPELRGNLPWRYALPTDYPDWWENHWEEDTGETPSLPVSRVVVSAGRIFVRSLRQIVALDAESLEPLWETSPTLRAGTARRLTNRGFAFRLEVVPTRYSDRERMLFDRVGAELGVVGDLVFAIEHEPGEPSQEIELQRGRFRAEQLRGTQLRALRASDGKVAWTQGRGEEDDPLGAVEFLSVPLEVRGELWIVYADDGDLHLGALDPATGELRRSLLLCSVDLAQVERILHQAIYPTSDGQTVYVSAGVGVVFAVDIEGFALDWAATYPRLVNPSDWLAPLTWHCGPAIPVGGAVIAAPPDSDFLLAFDRGTGRLLWRRYRPESARYIVAADNRHVWLGGEQIHCVNLTDGADVWRAPNQATLLTGRAVLSDQRVLAPARTELLAFDAGTGALLESRPIPDDQLPLGNLLCVGSALLSVDPNEVRKFPDLALAYPRALARFEENPNDPRAAVRVAWLELLRGAPKQAYAVLESAPAEVARDSARFADVTRLRVDALLGMARQADATPETALAHLEEAVALTATDRDRLRATLAYAATLRQMGRHAEAYLSLWALGLTSAGDGFVTVEPKLRNKARRVIGEVLARHERTLTARELAQIAQRATEALRAAKSRCASTETRAMGMEQLAHLAELGDAGGAGQEALLELARMARKAKRYERAEQYYREAIRRNRVGRITAAALVELAEQYLDDDQQLDAEAARLIERAGRTFADQPYSPSDGQPTGPVREALDRLRLRLDGRRVAAGTFALEPRRFELHDGPIQQLHDDSWVLVGCGNDAGEAWGKHILMFGPGDTLLATDQLGGQPAWSAPLDLLGRSVADVLDNQVRRTDGGSRVALCDGQTVVLNGESGAFAVGLLTGRRLWGLAYEEPDTARAVGLRNRLVAVDEGQVVCAPRRGVLACAPVGDGADLRWERILSGDRIDTVFLKDGYCITIDNERRAATAYNARNGRFLSRISFHQPLGGRALLPALYLRGHVVVPDGPDAVACYSVSTGERNWRLALTLELGWLFKPGDDHVGVSCRGGRIVLIDVLSGDIALDTVVPDAADGTAEGVLHGDALVLLATTRTARGDDPVLISLDRTTGDTRWRRDGFGVSGANRYALWKLLHAARDVVPMFRKEAVTGPNDFVREAGEIVVEIVDKATGAMVGPRVRTQRAASLAERVTGDVGLWPGQLVIGTRRGILSVPISEELDPQSGGWIEGGLLP